MTFDTENVLEKVLTIVQAGFSTRCAAVEAEKVSQGTGIPDGLPAPSSEAYYLQTWSDDILNHSPAVFYGVQEVATTGIGPATSQTFKIFVEVVVVDNGMDAYGVKRLLRYSRALRETLEAGFDSVPEFGRTKIETVTPVSFRLEEDSSEEIRVGGVILTLAIA